VLVDLLVEFILVTGQQISWLILGFKLYNLEVKKAEIIRAALIGGLYDGAFALLLALGPFAGGDIQTTFFMCLQVLGTSLITILILGLRLKPVHYYIILWYPYRNAGTIVGLCTSLISVKYSMGIFFRENTSMIALTIVAIWLIIIFQAGHFTFRDFSNEQEVLKFKKELDDFHYDTRVR
jgi:hypothetical protein